MTRNIAIEGVNGSGKTMVAKAISELLGFEYVRMPGASGIRVCEEIRTILQYNKIESEWANLMLYLADMAEWFAKMDPTKQYILDRSFLSTLVYQCGIGKLPRSIVKRLLIEINAMQVDKIILLVCDPEVAVKRLNERESKTLGNYKDRSVSFYASVQNHYIKEAKRLGKKVITIDTTNLTKQETIDVAITCVKNT